MSNIIISIYDPSNNIIKPLLKRQPKFYMKKYYDEESIGNDINAIIDYKFINKELISNLKKEANYIDPLFLSNAKK